MARRLLGGRFWTLALLAGSMPLGTVASCDLAGSGGSLFVNRFDDHHDDGLFGVGGPFGYGGGPLFYDGGFEDVVIVEDTYYGAPLFVNDPYYYCDPFFPLGCF